MKRHRQLITTAAAIAACTLAMAAHATRDGTGVRGGDGSDAPCPVEKITPMWSPGMPGDAGDMLGIMAMNDAGNLIAFSSYATYFLPQAEQLPSNTRQVVLYDDNTGQWELISVASTPNETIGANANCAFSVDMSPNGRYVAYTSYATNLTDAPVSGDFQQVYVRDRQE